MTYNIYDYFADCIADIAAAIPDDWNCTSFHHDAAPSYQTNGWHIWVMHHKKAKRDFEFADYSRFCVVPIDGEGCFIENAPSFDFDELPEVLAIVETSHNYGVE